MFFRFTSIDPPATAEVSTRNDIAREIYESTNTNIASSRRFVNITGVCCSL